MKLNFLSKTLPAFGLNVSGSSFKIVQMEKGAHGLSIKSYSSASLPKGLIVNDAISDQKTFSYLLKTALQQPHYGKITSNYVIASLPESKSFVRVIQIPQMSMAEAENAVPYEAESFIPLPIDQVYLDWQKIGDTGDKMNVLIVAAPKDFVDKYLDILDKAALRPLAFEVESQSAHRVLAQSPGSENMLLINIGSTRTSMIMIEDRNLQFTSTVPIAGNAFTESIARALGVSSSKAEEIKKKVGIANTVEYPNITTSLLPVLNNLTAEIKNILKFHAEHSQKQVSRIIIMGGTAGLQNLAEFLGQQL
ncbi:MAG TPA: type IV pilus assembly protein PilM, partial [Candidatus Limnocylindria bacterium]|nr:type IV pilus assembly protein PilM [Candidatus Limnocylindria bacterium]